MMQKLRLNLWLGIAGFMLTFMFSARNNLWITSLNRALLAFVIWFLAAFVLRWVFSFIMNPDPGGAHQRSAAPGTDTNEARGNLYDVSTPEEDKELMDLLKPESGKGQEGFKPLDPPKLVSTKDPEELAKAVRSLTEK
ncbi:MULTISPECIES: hypothetical protein [Paenibacillus]|uniref:Uncharacterized protein n=1 Tax=Paenibacillus campinasensis TaxID=66347 RepID=A0A268ES62_9BACL|nr:MULTISPECIES: hypothetical protein [Paenibacillus]MUG66736.1 hypothetical protein [Paenibacillus campinasensis]PAD75957.1 hypothetical protein CHH67_13515 [Paenibacillus campinasensis]PAK54641.1 hypothetical protein CHH75_07230 [Paenibacillus sp. 7541]